ncbi:hypothetical protein RH831_10850 [Halodesulfurarchaeum sp. HSR-GB]|uniref:hypothetical protein n=1 Tax=Halodesulfurarchaeum sp. HSR-GB TaxID=3074077 RepID=UPI00285C7FA2|nr:hypothetical protein [Halodesulfurarchaeum sp. HSR-GB]MDR5657674.1 hypothetical protein [Halodesulfurarchaeum sp. HSR-GB]
MEKYKQFHLTRVFLSIRDYLVENYDITESDFSQFDALDYAPLYLTGNKTEEVAEALWAIVKDLSEALDEIDQQDQSHPEPQQPHSSSDQERIRT